MITCNHTEAEKDTEVADGACPICLGAELETLREELAKVRYCPDCESVVTPQGDAWNVFYCGRCDKNLLPPQVDTYRGETVGKAQENIK